MTKVIPHLTCRNAAEAVDFYVRAFGATKMGVMPGADGKLMHAAIEIDGSMIFLMDEFPEWNALGPQSLNGSPVTIHLQVDDVDTVFNRAAEAGCTVTMPVELQFWGDRYGTLKDPYGHSWSVAQTVEQKTPEEMMAAMQAMAIGGPECKAADGKAN